MLLTSLELREEVRQRYAAAAKGDGCDCSSTSCCDDESFGSALYDRADAPTAAVLARSEYAIIQAVRR